MSTPIPRPAPVTSHTFLSVTFSAMSSHPLHSRRAPRQRRRTPCKSRKAFLSSRRAKIAPEQAELPTYGRTRRVPGLRRSEVADLAGVSVEYYSQLERGNLSGVSDGVLDALARALQLDEAERVHLADLARAAGPAARTRRTPALKDVRPGVQRILDGMTEVPAIVNNGRLDLVGAN